MKMKRIANQYILVVGLAGSALAWGCATDDDDVDERNAEIIDNLVAAGFPLEDIEIRETELVDDELTQAGPEPRVFVNGDNHVTLEASRELASNEELVNVEQPLEFDDQEGPGGQDTGGQGGEGSACSYDCQCKANYFCYMDGTCRGTVVFSPKLPLPVCVDACQCLNGTSCDKSSPGASYGYCH